MPHFAKMDVMPAKTAEPTAYKSHIVTHSLNRYPAPQIFGVATGASWLCYFKALQRGDINKVVPIDKSSTILTILLAFVFPLECMLLPCDKYHTPCHDQHYTGSDGSAQIGFYTGNPYLAEN